MEYSNKDLSVCSEDLAVQEKFMMTPRHSRRSRDYRISKFLVATIFLLIIAIILVFGTLSLYFYTVLRAMQEELAVCKAYHQGSAKFFDEPKMHIVEPSPLHSSSTPQPQTEEATSVIQLKPADGSHTETHHVLEVHHGISTYNIAHLFGDSSAMKEFNKSGESDPRNFRKKTRDPTCPNGAMLNGMGHYGDIWCDKLQLYMVTARSKNEHRFEYFQKAIWMNHNESEQNYQVLDTGKVVIKKTGMYIIQANVNFYYNDEGSLRIIKEEIDETKESIGACYTTVHKETPIEKSVFPCSAFQVAALNAGQKIYLDIQSYTYFKVNPSTLHMSIIRLNDKSIS